MKYFKLNHEILLICVKSSKRALARAELGVFHNGFHFRQTVYSELYKIENTLDSLAFFFNLLTSSDVIYTITTTLAGSKIM